MHNVTNLPFYGGGWGGPWWGGGWGGRRMGPGWRRGRWGAPYGGPGWWGWGGWYGRPYRQRMMYRRGYGCCCPVVLLAMLLTGAGTLAGSIAVVSRWRPRRYEAQG